MKKLTSFVVIAAATLLLAAFPAFAQHGHGAPMMSHGPSTTHGMSANHTTRAPHSTSTLSGKSASDLLTHNTKLASSLEKLLGLSGPTALQDLQTDAAGFKNLGQFVAAVHVSKNLDIPFDQLKAKMTGDNAESLGKAIKELKPAADAKVETKKANQQTHSDLDNTNSGS